MTAEQKEAVLTALRLLSGEGLVIEARIITNDGIGSGYFDDLEKLAGQVCILDENPQIRGIYVTLNKVNPALLARRANRLVMRLSKKDATTADRDILHRFWLPIDIDPIRPSGVSSSDDEHQYALEKAETIAGYLQSIGWPDPIIADSGNGAHLLYSISLDNDETSRLLIEHCLQALSTRFSDEICLVDTANFNAARIWKLYGTTSRKGDNTPERPYRRSALLSIPDHLEPVPHKLLLQLASLYPTGDTLSPVRSDPRDRNGESIDLGVWLESHNLGYSTRPYSDGTLFILDQCPFSDAHRDGAYAIQFGSGAIFAGCHHDSCGGGTQRWKELRRKYEGIPDFETRLAQLRSDRIQEKYLAEQGQPPVRTQKTKQAIPAKQSESDTNSSSGPLPAHGEESGSEGDTNPVSPEIQSEADRILLEDRPLRYMLETFAKDHEGDLVVAECLILSLASRTIINSKGLHVSITGESGKGKSHTIDTILTQIPVEFRLSGRISDKALFYTQDLRPGSVIALDDVALSEQMQEILKGVTTSFLRPFMYRTVTKDRSGLTCTIPERCVWWIAKVEGAGDDQIFNRMLTCWIDDSEELDRKVLSRTLSEAMQGPSTNAETRAEILVIRQMWKTLRPAWVIIPYADRITFQSVANRRNPGMLLDLIKTNATLMQYQREQTEIDGMFCIIATEEDFHQAVRLYHALNGETGGQITKLTRRESDLITAIRSMGNQEYTIQDMQRATGWTNSAISKLLNGYISRGNLYSGLLEKCPAISFYERSITSGETGQTTHRRTKVYVWDPDLYTSWIQGSSVLLRSVENASPKDDPPGSDDDPFSAGRQRSAQTGRFSADAETNQQEEIVQNLNCTHVHRDEQSFSAKSELTEQPASMHLNMHDSARALACAETDPASSTESESFLNQENNTGQIPAENCRNHTEKMHFCRNPGDFSPLEGWPDKTRCSLCGRSPTRYRRKQPGRDEKPVMICTDCYNQLVSKHVASMVTLPGVVQTGRMERLNAPGGRCHVCNIHPVTWIDRESYLGLCDSCYEREKNLTTREETA